MINSNGATEKPIPTIGIIVPPKDGPVPTECTTLYKGRANFISEGLGLLTMTPAGYDQVVPLIAEKARILAEKGVQAIVLMGTSLSFYQGEEFNAQLVREIEKASGLPATTMSYAIIDALRAVGCKKVTIGTAYVEDVNLRLQTFLEHHGFEVLHLNALEIEAVDQINTVTEEHLINLAHSAIDSAPSADCLLISCGGLRTLDLAEKVEGKTGIPVISSSVAGAWAGMRCLNLDSQKSGYGKLLSEEN